jgi:hypothetical protein
VVLSNGQVEILASPTVPMPRKNTRRQSRLVEECPSSDDLRHIAGFQEGGSGSSAVEIMRHVVDAASNGWRLFVV